MTSIDANILLHSYCEASPHHRAATAFLESLSRRVDVALSEFVLSETYLHARIRWHRERTGLLHPLYARALTVRVGTVRAARLCRLLGEIARVATQTVTIAIRTLTGEQVKGTAGTVGRAEISLDIVKRYTYYASLTSDRAGVPNYCIGC